MQKWYDLSYLAMDDTIDAVLNQWSAEWHATIDLVVGGNKSSAQEKEEAKLKMAQLIKKRKNEAIDKAQTEQAGKQTGGTEHGSNKGTRSPSPKIEEEETRQI